MVKNQLRQRVIDRLAVLGIGAVEAAARVPDLERNYIRDLLEGKKESFNQKKVPAVAQALEWTAAELMGQVLELSGEGIEARITLVPLLDSVTAGRLKSPMSQIPFEDVPLLAFADLGSGDWFGLKVEGDSMNRVSPEDSTIIVNRDDRQLINGKCYVFSVRGQTTYKMWQAKPVPHLKPYSTNPVHDAIFPEKKRDLEVIGRVRRTVLDL